MNKVSFISTSLVHKPKCVYLGKTIDKVEVLNKVFTVDLVDLGSKFVFWTSDKHFLDPLHLGLLRRGFRLSDVKPIVRHDDDFVRECVQADYNGGRPFIPAVELYKENTSLAAQLLSRDKSQTKLTLTQWDMLLGWHFWFDKPEDEEVVYVTDTFNPYK